MLGLFFDKTTSLHSLWDTDMIEHRISTDFQNDQNKYYNYLLNLLHTTYASDISQWSRCPSADESRYLACSTAWINENVELNCAYVYRDEQDHPMNTSQQFHLGQNYYNTRIHIVEQRLLQSGVRLGVVINKIVELQKHHHKKDDDELCTGTVLLIVAVFLQTLLMFFCIIYCLVRRTLYRHPMTDTPPKYQSINDVKT